MASLIDTKTLDAKGQEKKETARKLAEGKDNLLRGYIQQIAPYRERIVNIFDTIDEMAKRELYAKTKFDGLSLGIDTKCIGISGFCYHALYDHRNNTLNVWSQKYGCHESYSVGDHPNNEYTVKSILNGYADKTTKYTDLLVTIVKEMDAYVSAMENHLINLYK